ncbi:hypothetical protein GCM10022251_20950 [Phytohabitans flavus]
MAVVAVHDAREYAGLAAAQRDRVDTGPLDRLPRDFQQEPLLRVRGKGLARAHTEELGVEVSGVVQEPARPGVRGAGVVRVGVVQRIEVPAAVGGEAADRVDAVADEPPQVFRRGDAARVAAGHTDDDDRIVGVGDEAGQRRGGLGVRAKQFVEQVPGEGARGRVVEDERGRQPQPDDGTEAVAQLDRGERVETQVLEGLRRVDLVSAGVPERGGDLAAHKLQHGAPPLSLVQPGQALRQATGGAGDRAASHGRTDQATQERRYLAGRPDGRQVQPDRHHRRRSRGERGVEKREPLLDGQRRCAGAGEPLGVHGHAFGPRSPGERDGR